MLTCGHCENPLVCHYDPGTGRRMYRCGGAMIPPSASHKGINKVAEVVERAVVGEMRHILSTDVIRRLSRKSVEETNEQDVADIRREEEQLNRQQDEAGQDLADAIKQHRQGKLTDLAYDAVKRNLENNMDGIQKRLHAVKERRKYLDGNNLRLSRAREAIVCFRDSWEQLDTERQRGLLQALVADITASHEGRNLRLRFRYHFLPATEVLLRPMKGAAGVEGAEQLSQRELAVLHLWGRGLSDADIAQQFEVFESAVRRCYYLIRRKLGEGDLQRCLEIAGARIEAELAYLPLQGRVNQRNHGQGLLTSLETEVMAAREQGEGYEQIANRLGKSVSSVYNVVYNARCKLRERGQDEV